MTNDEKAAWRDRIDTMTHMEMALIQRLAPTAFPACPIFDGRKHGLYQYFQERFKGFGGMTEGITEAIGW